MRRAMSPEERQIGDENEMERAVRIIRDGEVIEENWIIDDSETVKEVLDRVYDEFSRKYKNDSPFFVFDTVKLEINIQKEIE